MTLALTRTITCAGCRQALAATDDNFSCLPSGKHRNKCKPCRASEERRRFGLDPAKRAASIDAWRKANPEKLAGMNKRAKLRGRYGIGPEDYHAIEAAQGGLCAICHQPDGGGRWGVLVVDHHDSTGRVRALLCHNCNTSLGLMAEDPARLRAAADYLERHASTDGAERSGTKRKPRVKRSSTKQEENTVLMDAA